MLITKSFYKKKYYLKLYKKSLIHRFLHFLDILYIEKNCL